MAIMYSSKENFTCPKEQISLKMYLSVLKQFLFGNMKPCVNSLVNSEDPDQDPHCFTMQHVNL